MLRKDDERHHNKQQTPLPPKQHDKDGPALAHNSLSSRLSLTTSLFDMLSETSPPTQWVPPSKSPLTSTPASRKVDHKDRKQRARLPIGPSGTLVPAIDHPLCAECTNVLLSIMDTQLDELRRERDAYLAFEEELKRRETSEKEDYVSKEEIDKVCC